mmetsp:Transcript_157/g.175  ORF Transcript_157/g.175 Transcript_157/m.175 type:complete len:98 (-) Transcript_157:715-1008(-)
MSLLLNIEGLFFKGIQLINQEKGRREVAKVPQKGKCNNENKLTSFINAGQSKKDFLSKNSPKKGRDRKEALKDQSTEVLNKSQSEVMLITRNSECES